MWRRKLKCDLEYPFRFAAAFWVRNPPKIGGCEWDTGRFLDFFHGEIELIAL